MNKYLIIVISLLRVFAGASAEAEEWLDYDRQLCAQAQRIITNAGPEDFQIRELSGQGEGFHSIQMDAQPGLVTIATSWGLEQAGQQEIVAWVACKMVNQARVNDVLNLELTATQASCRTINEFTYARALEALSPEQRDRYETKGRKLRFSADYIAVSGGEWLPGRVEDHIVADERGLRISAPSVRVPWVEGKGEFYQGTHHCKLITQAAMSYWLTEGAFTGDQYLFTPRADVCAAPSSMTSEVGSCRFWFAPAQAMFCQDYSGSGWDIAAARDACSKRHASRAAQAAAGNKYAGAGGLFSVQSCDVREDAVRSGGTCVFHCGAGDETLWHTPDSEAASPVSAAIMNKACDLYIDRRP